MALPVRVLGKAELGLIPGNEKARKQLTATDAPRSVTKSASVSLVTYTYNDHALAAGLLADVAGWTVAPREIIVVDDGTPEPFVPPRMNPRVTVIRFTDNQGCAAVTAAGIGAATGKYVLSIDADMRLSPDWLEKCLPYAARKNIGMAASRIEHKTGSAVLNAYLDAMYSKSELKGVVKFIPGPVYMLRKEVFDAIGGLSGYGDKRGQDTYLCGKLVEKGYDLYRVPGIAARQTRRLSLPQCVKRCLSWDMPYFLKRMARKDGLEELLPIFILGVGKRMEAIGTAGGLVQYVHLVLILSGCLRIAEGYGDAAVRGVWRSFVHFLRDRPQALAALARDAGRFGMGERRTDGEGARFAGLDALLGDVFPAPVLDAMDAALTSGRVDEAAQTDFSMYEAD